MFVIDIVYDDKCCSSYYYKYSYYEWLCIENFDFGWYDYYYCGIGKYSEFSDYV